MSSKPIGSNGNNSRYNHPRRLDQLQRLTRQVNQKKGHGMYLRALIALMFLAVSFSVAIAILFTASTNKQQDSLQREESNPKQRRDQDNDAVDYAPVQPVPSPGPTPQRQTVEDLITWILQSSTNDKDFNTQHSAMERIKDSPNVPFQFTPGSLKLSHAETMKHCYVDPNIYGGHLKYRSGGGGDDEGKRVLVSYSDKHKLAYIMIPKSGSSTARFMLKNEFHASEVRKSLYPPDYAKGQPMEGVEVITFVRDPLSRFYSQYDEAYVRTAPWQKGNEGKNHPFSYIYENLHSYHDYEDVFCPPSTRNNPNNRKECLFRPTQENGTLASRFERFVNDYDGKTPFDVHLALQAPMLATISGNPLYVTQIYNTSDSERGWKEIAKQFLGEDAASFGKQAEKNVEGQTKVSGGVIEGRSYPRRFNSTMVSKDAQRRICELTLLDYCCLNLPLPAVCRGVSESGRGFSRELFCILGQDGRIQPGVVPR